MDSLVDFWPKTWKEYAVRMVFLLSLVAVAFACFYFYPRLDSKTKNGFLLLLSRTGDTNTFDSDYYHIGIWTPNEDTVKDMVNIHGDSSSSNYNWHMQGSKEKNAEYRKLVYERLGTENISGFRRFPVEGMGRSEGLKRGYWWIFSLNRTIRPEQFADIYRECWITDSDKESNFYMEVEGNPDFLDAY